MNFLKDDEIEELGSDVAYKEFSKAVREVQLLRQQAKRGDRESVSNLKAATDYMFKLDARMNKLDSHTPESKPLFGESKAVSFIRSAIKAIKKG